MEVIPDHGLNARLSYWSSWDRCGDKSTRLQWFYKRACGRHMAYRSKGAVARNLSTLQCPVCNPRGNMIFGRRGRARVVSPDEERLWKLLHELFGSNLHWSVQDRIKGWHGAVDVCLYYPLRCWLCVQVDGMTHRGKRCMSDRDEQRQLATDARFDAAALAQGRSVLRLDSKHGRASWRRALGQAVVACMSGGPAQVFRSQP